VIPYGGVCTYSQGESEEEVKSMGFDSVFIYRPA